MTIATYYSNAEARAARTLIRTLLDAGCAISVNDGESWVLRRSLSANAIYNALGSTGADTLKAYHVSYDINTGEATYTTAGVFFLVYGNAEDGSELVADYSGDAFCDAIINKAGL